MKRLTVEKEKHGFKRVYIASCQDGCIYKAYCEEAGCNCTEVSAIIARLAKIENILSDENGEYDLDRLREIFEAEKHGKLKVVPCKEGDSLYFYSDALNEICKAKIIKVEFNFYLPKHTIWISFEYDSKLIGRQD